MIQWLFLRCQIENVQIPQDEEIAKLWLHNPSSAGNQGGQMCVGKTTDVIWECSEARAFELRQSCFHRNYSLIRPHQGCDFLSWINLTQCPFPELTGTPLPEQRLRHGKNATEGRSGSVSILSWITNTHLVIKCSESYNGKMGETRRGPGMKIIRAPWDISHKSYSFISLYTFIWEQQTL